MSDDRYEPPEALLRDDLGSTIVGTGEVDVVAAYREATSVTFSTFGTLLVAGLIYFVVSAVATVTVIGIFLILPVMLWGGVYLGLRLLDGTAEVGHIFAGFQRFGQALGRMLGFGVMLYVPLFAVQLPVQFAVEGMVATGAIGPGTAILIGQGLSFALGLVIVRVYFAVFLIVDRDLGPIDAIRESWLATEGQWLRLIALSLLSLVVFTIGFFALIVGLIPASMINMLVWCVAYRQLFGRAGDASAPGGLAVH